MRHDATNHAPARGALRAGPHRTVRHSGRAARGQLFCPGVRAADRAAGGKRQRQDHAAQGGRRAAAPHRAVPSGRRPAGESVHPQACADRQLYPAAERHLGLALGAGGRAYGLQPAAGGLAKPHRRHARRCGRGPAHRRSGQQGWAGLPDLERRREAALYSGAHDCRGCAAALAGRAGQCA